MAGQTFLQQNSSSLAYQKASFIVMPVPYEATTTYGHGTKGGPAAIIKASHALESFDEDLLLDVAAKQGIFTTKACSVNKINDQVKAVLADSKIPIILGGEHSITAYALKAFADKFKNLSVLQLDAHADLRNSYQGSKFNHGCVMRRVLEVCPAVQVGLRSLSEEEYDFAKQKDQIKRLYWAREPLPIKQIISQLTDNVYITIDVDVFDPSVVPATGTPEPGGLLWQDVLALLKQVCRAKNVVGFDVMELAPKKGDIASDFTVAKLVYKLMGDIQ